MVHDRTVHHTNGEQTGTMNSSPEERVVRLVDVVCRSVFGALQINQVEPSSSPVDAADRSSLRLTLSIVRTDGLTRVLPPTVLGVSSAYCEMGGSPVPVTVVVEPRALQFLVTLPEGQRLSGPPVAEQRVLLAWRCMTGELCYLSFNV